MGKGGAQGQQGSDKITKQKEKDDKKKKNGVPFIIRVLFH